MLTLKVPDMSCGHCAATIEKAVKSVDPAAKVKADIEGKTVSIDSAAQEKSIKAAITTAGYPNEQVAA